MNTTKPGAATRLSFSLALMAILGGCAGYPAPNPQTATYAYGTDVTGQTVYAAPPIYAAPLGYPAPLFAPNPYYYDPLYLRPPVSLSFGYQNWGYRGYPGYGPAFRGGYRGSYRGPYRGGFGAGPWRRR